MLDFAKRRNLVQERRKVVKLSFLSATISYIGRQTGCRAVRCWIDENPMLVFEVSSYSGPKPPTWVEPSDLPSKESINRLAALLKVRRKPYWYLYDDGTQLSMDQYASVPWDEYDKECTSDEDDFSSDEEWDSNGDETEVACPDNDGDENSHSDDGNDPRGEIVVSSTHRDAGDEPMSDLPPAFDASCRI